MSQGTQIGNHVAKFGAVGRCAICKCVNAYVSTKIEASTAIGKVHADVVSNRPRIRIFVPT